MVAYLRSRHSTDDFEYRHRYSPEIDFCIKTKGQESGRIFGRPFITAGWIVIEVAFVVAVAEVTLFVFLLNHPVIVCSNSYSFILLTLRVLRHE